MTQKEIDQLKEGAEAILMDTMQFVNVGRVDLPSAINIRWRHDPHELVLTKITAKEVLELNKPIDLKKQNILILNYNHPGHERLYKIEVDKEKKKATLLELHDKSDYALKISIIDNQ